MSIANNNTRGNGYGSTMGWRTVKPSITKVSMDEGSCKSGFNDSSIKNLTDMNQRQIRETANISIEIPKSNVPSTSYRGVKEIDSGSY